MTDEKIARINELYHKSKKEGLTDEELLEKKQLYQEYITSIKQNLQRNLDSIRVENPDGSIVPLTKKTSRS